MELNSFHHVEFVVSNAVQASYWYCANFGFRNFAEKKSETQFSIAVKSGPVVLVFTSPRGAHIDPDHERHLRVHGDAVYDVAFLVDCIETTVAELKRKGGDVIDRIGEICDENGSVLTAKVGTVPGNLIHTLVQKTSYKGLFLPGYEKMSCAKINAFENLPPITYEALDHVVENYPNGALEDVGEWYRRNLNLQRFWSVDDKTCHTEYSAMNSWLMVNETHDVQVTICEPVPNSKRARNQIQEFVDYNGGPGIQHIALRVPDIVTAIESMKQRSVQFLSVPDSYYEQLGARLAQSKVKIAEDIEKLRELKILIDFDDNGYLLQIFTQPVQDRPTLFLEIIQRRNFNGFGAGNFKSLFEAVEREQAKRGTLFEDDDLQNRTY